MLIIRCSRYDEGLQYLEDALKLDKDLYHHVGIQHCWADLNYHHFKKFGKAKKYAQQAFKLYENNFEKKDVESHLSNLHEMLCNIEELHGDGSNVIQFDSKHEYMEEFHSAEAFHLWHKQFQQACDDILPETVPRTIEGVFAENNGRKVRLYIGMKEPYLRIESIQGPKVNVVFDSTAYDLKENQYNVFEFKSIEDFHSQMEDVRVNSLLSSEVVIREIQYFLERSNQGIRVRMDKKSKEMFIDNIPQD